MAYRILVAATVLNAVVFPFAVVVGFFSGGFDATWFPYLWLVAAILNALVFLAYFRHAHRNPELTQAQRDRWEILLFIFSPVAPIVYFCRHVGRPEYRRAP